VERNVIGPWTPDQREPDIITIFHVINVSSSRHRLKLMHTVTSADMPLHTEPFCMEVQLMDDHRREWDDLVLIEGIRVHGVADPEWIVPQILAPFPEFATRLTRFYREVPDSEYRSCVFWQDGRRTLPPMPIVDPSYPTVSLIVLLKAAGYVAHAGTVTHTMVLAAGTSGKYDGREALRQKWYYQVLLRLAACLPLSGGSIPSQEPVAYYKLLLRGEHACPGLSSKEYVVQWNRGKGLQKGDFLPLDDIHEPAPVPTPLDFYPSLIQGPEPKRKKRDSGPGRRIAKGGGKDGGEPPVPLPPPPESGPDDVVDPTGGAPDVVDPGVTDPGTGSGGAAGSGGGGEGSSGGPGVAAGSGGPGDFWAPAPNMLRGQGVPTESLDGLMVQFNRYVNPRGKEEPHSVCQCDRHPDCTKRRGSVEAYEKEFGRIEPLAFLHAWHQVHFPTKPCVLTHAQDNPPKAAMRAIAIARRAELEDVCDRAGR
jgi:hypothetical protein